MSDPILVRIAHHIPGRTRLTMLSSRGETDLQSCAARLAASGGIHVEIRGASLILAHRIAPAQNIRAALQPPLEAAGFALAPPAPRHPIGKTTAAVSRLNSALSDASSGRMDLTNAAFLALIAGGFVQLARGNVAGPAITLFGQALTLALLQAKLQER